MQIIVVDFEYASPNPAPFDIANHFHEWTTSYAGPVPHVLDPARYPSLDERRNFYRAYLTHASAGSAEREGHREGEGEGEHDGAALAAEMDRLESQVRAWSPAAQAMWAVWGVVQAREFVEGQDESEPEFDYLGHSQCRVDAFRRELVALGVPGVGAP